MNLKYSNIVFQDVPYVWWLLFDVQRSASSISDKMNEDVYTVNIVLQVCDLPRNIQIESVNIGLINMKYTVKGNKS